LRKHYLHFQSAIFSVSTIQTLCFSGSGWYPSISHPEPASQGFRHRVDENHALERIYEKQMCEEKLWGNLLTYQAFSFNIIWKVSYFGGWITEKASSTTKVFLLCHQQERRWERKLITHLKMMLDCLPHKCNVGCWIFKLSKLHKVFT
jgi:hypothetical protein